MDANLSESEKNDIVAWSSLVQHRLANAQIYNWWAESTNYDEVTSLVYSRVLSFPLNFFLPGRYKKSALAQLAATGFADERVAYEEAARCYKALSIKLGDKQYMLGANPTSLDAVVFGFLATQFLPNLPQRKLHYLISQHSNLVDYINRILSTYFSATAPIAVDTEPAQRWLKSIEDEKAEQRRVAADAPVKDSSSAWAVALGIGATVLFMSTQNLQFLALYKQFSARFGSKSKPAVAAAPSRKFSHEQEEERAKWFGGMVASDEERSPHQDTSDAIARAASDPDANPMKQVHRFAPDDDAVVYIGDDGNAYDWDEQYLEEMETGSDIPEDHEDLGEDEEEEYD